LPHDRLVHHGFLYENCRKEFLPLSPSVHLVDISCVAEKKTFVVCIDLSRYLANVHASIYRNMLDHQVPKAPLHLPLIIVELWTAMYAPEADFEPEAFKV